MSIIKNSHKMHEAFMVEPFKFSINAVLELKNILGNTNEVDDFVRVLQRRIALVKCMPEQPLYTSVLKKSSTEIDGIVFNQIEKIKKLAEKLSDELKELKSESKECISVGYKRGKLGYGSDDRQDDYICHITNEVEWLHLSVEIILNDTKAPRGSPPSWNELYLLRLIDESLHEKISRPIKVSKKVSKSDSSIFPKIIKVVLPEAGYKERLDVSRLIEGYIKYYINNKVLNSLEERLKML